MKRPHYFYKTPATSVVGQQLQQYINRCDEASEKARQWAEKQGATSYIESPQGMAGGIAALEIENCVSKEGLERIVMPNGNVIFIPEPDSELEHEMFSLPIVSEVELIAILHLRPRIGSNGKKLPITFGDQTPILFLYRDYWYFDVPYESQAQEVSLIPEKEFYRRRLSALNTSQLA